MPLCRCHSQTRQRKFFRAKSQRIDYNGGFIPDIKKISGSVLYDTNASHNDKIENLIYKYNEDDRSEDSNKTNNKWI